MPRFAAAVDCSHVPVMYLPVRLPVSVPPALSSLPSKAVLSALASIAALTALFCTGLVLVLDSDVSTVMLLPAAATLSSTYCFTTWFATGLFDDPDMALSMVTWVAPAAIPSSLALSALDIRPLADVVATAVPAFLSSAALTTLFCTGLVLVADSALSTSTPPLAATSAIFALT